MPEAVSGEWPTKRLDLEEALPEASSRVREGAPRLPVPLAGGARPLVLAGATGGDDVRVGASSSPCADADAGGGASARISSRRMLSWPASKVSCVRARLLIAASSWPMRTSTCCPISTIGTAPEPRRAQGGAVLTVRPAKPRAQSGRADDSSRSESRAESRPESLG